MQTLSCDRTPNVHALVQQVDIDSLGLCGAFPGYESSKLQIAPRILTL